MWDHCSHQFLAHVEGRDAYSGRIKYLLNCRSVVVAHRIEWNQQFHAALDPDPVRPPRFLLLDAWEESRA